MNRWCLEKQGKHRREGETVRGRRSSVGEGTEGGME